MVEPKNNTDSVLAFADEVIASLGTERLCAGSSHEQYLATPDVSFFSSNMVNSSSQTENFSINKGVQHLVSTKSVAVGSASTVVHRGIQTESSTCSLAIQTDDDMFRDFVKESLKKSTSIAFSGLAQMEELWRKVLKQFNRSFFLIEKLMKLVLFFRNSCDVVQKKLASSKAILKETFLMKEEIECRQKIIGSEQDLRYHIVLNGYNEMSKFYRKSEAAFLATQNELFEKIDAIDILQQQLSECVKNVAISSNLDRSVVSHAEQTTVDEKCANDSINEMKQLLNECWLVLGQNQ